MELDSDESDWEPEAEVMPPEREQTRSGRQRKRPSFFQEFESQENNLDSILAEFEQTQVISRRGESYFDYITLVGQGVWQAKGAQTPSKTSR